MKRLQGSRNSHASSFKTSSKKNSSSDGKSRSIGLPRRMMQDSPETSRKKGKDPTRYKVNIRELNKLKKLSECEESLEFILVTMMKAFDFEDAAEAVTFISGGVNSKYA